MSFARAHPWLHRFLWEENAERRLRRKQEASRGLRNPGRERQRRGQERVEEECQLLAPTGMKGSCHLSSQRGDGCVFGTGYGRFFGFFFCKRKGLVLSLDTFTKPGTELLLRGLQCCKRRSLLVIS